MDQMQESPAQLRRRLLNPVNGRHSDEIEVRPHYKVERERARIADEEHRAKRDARRQQAIAAAIEAARDIEKEALEAARLAQADLPPKPPRLADIIAEVCGRYRVTEIDLLSKRRQAGIVLPRQIAMYLCKVMTFKSLPEIGRRFGGKDHTTVLYGVRKIASLVENFPHLASEIEEIKKSLSED